MSTQREQAVIWKIEGKIVDHEEFNHVLSELVMRARSEAGTLLYWWCVDPSGSGYADLDCYRDEESALKHLNSWEEVAADFARCATIERCTVYGDVSEAIRERLEALAPCYFCDYGGFTKEPSADAALEHGDVIWTMEGLIEDTEKFHETMEIFSTHTCSDDRVRMQWWTIKPFEKDGAAHERLFHVIVHYADAQGALEYVKLWDTYGHLLVGSAEIVRVGAYSLFPLGLSEAMSPFEPEQMTWIAGFAR